ncbi:hypothetical protein CDD80_6146 [Ophiocordyceps camponoti-rufipedis]|uniref:Rhodopsin domain-containing protein n=1 Tax=Ophiocordyceps camponoti-rufipedis TaxID=2004952 RepID=A0A2C5ZFS0_9HYPO|nr:hypothetical protein CDD80_6146 [Ophiocordyceps camponoti-rufipedis]
MITPILLLLVELAVANPILGNPGSQISDVVKDGGKRIQLAGMQFPRKDSMASSGAGMRRQSFPSGSRATRHRATTSRTGVTRVPGEPMGPAKKHPCCKKWTAVSKRSLDCVPCDDGDWQDLPDQAEQGSEDVIDFINEDGVKNSGVKHPGGKDARASSTFEDRKGGVSQDLKGAATQDLASIGSKELVNPSATGLAGGASEQVVGQSLDQELVDGAADSLADMALEEGTGMASADGAAMASPGLAAMASDGLATSEEVASSTASELSSLASEELEDLATVAASEDLAAAIAEGLPVDLPSDALKPPRTDKLAWRRLGAANKQLLYYKPGRDVRKIPVAGLKTAIVLKALLLAGPSGREGLRELVPAFKDFDNLVGEVQEYLFGAQQSDIDGNETKSLLIQWFKHLAEATQPALTYQPSPYQRSYRERMDAAWQYNHPVLTNYDKCLRIWQNPHPNYAYQAYLETINCDPLYKLSIPESPHENDDVRKGMPKLTPRERCQRVKENPHSSEWYQSMLVLAHCREPEVEDGPFYPTELTPGDKCHAVRREPHPRKEYQALLLAWHCNSDMMSEDEVITSLPAGALTQPGTPPDLDCEKWIMIKNKQNCETLADMAVTDRDNIVRWNSAYDEACPRLWIGRYACIAANRQFRDVRGDGTAMRRRHASALRCGGEGWEEGWGLELLDGRPVLELGVLRLKQLGKIMYAAPTLFVANQCFVKFSILLLYLRLFAIDRAVVRSVYAIAVVHVCYSLISLPLYLFRCRPVRKGWDMFEQGGCIDFVRLVPAVESVNSAVDLALVVLACVVVRGAGVLGFVKIGIAYVDSDVGHTLTAIWTVVQMAVSIICCCAPTYKPILPSEGFLRRLGSRIRRRRRQNKVQTSSSPPPYWAVQGSHSAARLDRGRGLEWLDVDRVRDEEDAPWSKEPVGRSSLEARACSSMAGTV